MISSWIFFWLVSGEVSESQHHQPSGSNWSAVYMLVGSIQLTPPSWWACQYLQNSSKILFICLKGEPGPCLKAALLFLDCSSLVSSSPRFPDYQLFEPALWNSGKVIEAEAHSLKIRNGGHRKTFMPRSPTGSCSVSFLPKPAQITQWKPQSSEVSIILWDTPAPNDWDFQGTNSTWPCCIIIFF